MTSVLPESIWQTINRQFNILLVFFKQMHSIHSAKLTLDKHETAAVKSYKDEQKLKYREWNSVPRRDLFSGYIYVKFGNSPVTLNEWRRVYLVERQDYNVDIYGTEEDYTCQKPPRRSISVVGYNLMLNAGAWVKQTLHDFAEVGIQLNAAVMSKLSSISPFAWGLIHEWRVIYVFQLHEPQVMTAKKKGCLCFGGGSSVAPLTEESYEYTAERKQWVSFMEKVVTMGSARDLTTIHGMAFEAAVQNLKTISPRLHEWHDDGTEQEILTGAMMEFCLSPLKAILLQGLDGPVSFRLMKWGQIKDEVLQDIEKRVPPVLSMVQSETNILEKKMAREFGGIAGIVQQRSSIMRQINSHVTVEMLIRSRTILMQPILRTFCTGFNNATQFAFDRISTVYQEEVYLGNIPKDKSEMKAWLDAIPRRTELADEIYLLTREVEEVITSDAIAAHISGLSLRMSIVKAALTTLDAAMFTLEAALESGQTQSAKDQVKQALEVDCKLNQAETMKMCLNSVIVPYVKTNLYKFQTGADMVGMDVVEQICKQLEVIIPDVLKEYLHCATLIRETVTNALLDEINRKVDADYNK